MRVEAHGGLDALAAVFEWIGQANRAAGAVGDGDLRDMLAVVGLDNLLQTQQVALKAIPRLRQNAAASSIRGYLFATARSVLGGFWSTRLGLSEAELHEDLMLSVPPEPPSEGGTETVQRILAQLSDNYRRVLELRFLYGYSLKEVAAEMNSTVGAIKVMQLRALRAAAKVRPGE